MPLFYKTPPSLTRHDVPCCESGLVAVLALTHYKTNFQTQIPLSMSEGCHKCKIHCLVYFEVVFSTWEVSLWVPW